MSSVKSTVAERAEERRLKLIWEESMYDASIEQGNLRIAWKPIYSVSSSIYGFKGSYGMNLLHLKLIGVELKELPADIGDNLLDLMTMSLENNKLTCLPNSITKLINLKELNVSYNAIKYLPDRVGFMYSLVSFRLNNNQLEELPITFGALTSLEKVDIECNKIKILPENLDNMILCNSFNANRNQLIRLPRCIARMPSLTMLSAAWNNLTFLPQELFQSQTLKVLRLGNNRISTVSDRMGDLAQLVELVLDYNALTRLPLSFHKLTHLTILRMEGNPDVIDPPSEIVVQGASAVVGYFQQLYSEDKLTRMRHIILATQNLLQQVVDRKFADPANFEAEVQLPGGGPDLWYALQWAYFWSTCLPKLKLYWQFLHAKGIEARDLVTEFVFSEKEVLWAFSQYADAVGGVLRKQQAMFRKCACVDPATGFPKPCVPPKVGYRCYRECVLIKKQLIRQKDKVERVWFAYKHDRMVDAERRAEHEAQLYLQSAEGKQFIETAAYEQAEELLLEGNADKIVQQRLTKLEGEKQRIIASYDKRIAVLAKSRDAKANIIQSELDELKENRKLARQGYMRDSLENRIQQLTFQLAHLPENIEIRNLQAQCETDCAAAEERIYNSSSSEEEEDEENQYSDSSLYSSDDHTEEAEKWRKRRSRFFARKQQEKNLEIARELYQQHKRAKQSKKEGEKTLLTTLRSTLKNTLDNRIIDPLKHPESTMLGSKLIKLNTKVQKKWRNVKEISRIRVRRFFQKMQGNFDELMRELKYELQRQYIAHEVQQAREKTRNEFTVIETGIV